MKSNLINKDKILVYIKGTIFLQPIFILYSISSAIAKKTSSYAFFSYEFIILYGIILFILVIYALIWQMVLKKLPLTVAYSNKGVVVLWTFLWAVIFFNEHINMNNIIGGIIVIIGIGVINKNES